MAASKRDISWSVLKKAAPVLDDVRGEYPTQKDYEDDREALKDFLCVYFNSGNCITKSGNSISPISGSPIAGAKVLKVRWTRPGQGKRGALRLVTLVYCAPPPRVEFACAFFRKDDPTEDEIVAALKS